MDIDILEVLGKEYGTPAVTSVLEALEVTDVYEDPPFDRYIGSPRAGIDLLFHRDRVVDVQIYVEPDDENAAYTGELPYGLRRGMNQQDVHRLFGESLSDKGSGSRFRTPDGRKLATEYDDESKLRYVSVSVR